MKNKIYNTKEVLLICALLGDDYRHINDCFAVHQGNWLGDGCRGDKYKFKVLNEFEVRFKDAKWERVK